MATTNPRIPITLGDEAIDNLEALRGTYGKATFLRELVTTELKKLREQAEAAKT